MDVASPGNENILNKLRKNNFLKKMEPEGRINLPTFHMGGVSPVHWG